MPPLIRYEIRITSGDHAGCYLGAYVGGGLVTNPEARDNPDVTAWGKRFSLLATEHGHTMFGDKDEVNRIIADLKQQGYDAELIDTYDPNADTFENRVQKAVGFYLRQDAGTTMVVDLNEKALRKATPDDIKRWNEEWNRLAAEAYARTGVDMDWWVIEYDNRNFDSHKFLKSVQDELGPLFIAAGGGPPGAGVFHPMNVSEDGKERLYFNSKAAGIQGVSALLSRYQTKSCNKPSEFCGVFVGNHAEPLNSPLPRK